MPPQRKILGHHPPTFVSGHAWFFITICCQQRTVNQLCQPAASAALLADGIFYHNQQRWGLHLLLLMPDHLHLIAGFPKADNMSEVIRNWKRLVARRSGIAWQSNYFDHRVRPDEGLQIKTDYIRQNPVRAGLAATPEAWPHFVDYNTLEQGR
jgi:putative transposase